MRKISTIWVAAVLLAPASAAGAADFGMPYTPPPIVEPLMAGNWYLRGDVGAGWSGGWMREKEFAGSTGRWHERNVGDSTSIGGGVGYQFSNFLRGDITAEWRTGISLRGSGQESYMVGAFRYTGTAQVQGTVRVATVLANGYVDLGSYWGVTPYVGAGIGAAYRQISGTQSSVNPIPDGFGGVLRYDSVQSSYKKTSGVDLAWALYAGASFDVNEHLKIDAGYRYLNVGSPTTGALIVHPGGARVKTPLSVDDLSAHDFRIGARWLLPAPAPMAPVIAKN
ncbi:outer membrane protein [Prosthecomicrobium sp. N25]|uniref:outer membrane protein n=1 Tax=Prosthecomicrobium sp. N25 TaxID=3129254 RepID=UPI00307793D7